MARVCEICGKSLLVKNTAWERNTWSPSPSYRCMDCVRARIEEKVKETRRALGLETEQADS